MKKNRSRLFALLLLCVVAWQYAHWTWKTHVHAEQIALSLEGKPFVLRALVPWLARGLMWLGFTAETALTILIILFAVGLYYGLDYLQKSFRS